MTTDVARNACFSEKDVRDAALTVAMHKANNVMPPEAASIVAQRLSRKTMVEDVNLLYSEYAVELNQDVRGLDAIVAQPVISQRTTLDIVPLHGSASGHANTLTPVEGQLDWAQRNGLRISLDEVKAVVKGENRIVDDISIMTSCQVKALRWLLETCENNDGAWAFVSGHAGTGKTVLLRILITILERRRKKLVKTAYTNAASVEIGGDKSFEAVLGIAYLHKELTDIPDGAYIEFPRIHEYLLSKKTH